jgi:hypothetical protein
VPVAQEDPMRKLLAVGVFLVPALWCASGALEACGDKFLLVGRAFKYQKAYAAAHPASILIYENPHSHLALVAHDLQLQQLLTGAGHKVRVVTDLPALERAIEASSPDLVLADGDDIIQIEQRMPKSTSTLVPVLYSPTRQGLAAAERAYGAVLHAPGNSRHPLAVIDDALKNRSKRTASTS